MSCLIAFHYRSYGTFFLQQNRLHNIDRGFTHYKYYRAFKHFENLFKPRQRRLAVLKYCLRLAF